jgi:hypothetical protein
MTKTIKARSHRLKCEAIRSGNFISGFRCEAWRDGEEQGDPVPLSEHTQTQIDIARAAGIRSFSSRHGRFEIEFEEPAECESKLLDESRVRRSKMECKTGPW